MLSRTLQLLLVGCMMAGTLWAAENPFVGKWTVNPSMSKLYDEMRLRSREQIHGAIHKRSQQCRRALVGEAGLR
jgi:hypothetical protein